LYDASSPCSQNLLPEATWVRVLGLFISKNIVEAHGGKICGENNADGKGSTFVFTLSSKRNDE
jgi:signal transduction histidine kinase